METYEVLEQAKSLIEDPNYWTTGQISNPLPDGRVQYCAEGAIDAFSMQGHWEVGEALSALDRVASSWGRCCAVCLNDKSHDHALVMKMFNAAIRAEKAKAGIAVDLPEEVPSASMA